MERLKHFRLGIIDFNRERRDSFVRNKAFISFAKASRDYVLKDDKSAGIIFIANLRLLWDSFLTIGELSEEETVRAGILGRRIGSEMKITGKDSFKKIMKSYS